MTRYVEQVLASLDSAQERAIREGRFHQAAAAVYKRAYVLGLTEYATATDALLALTSMTASGTADCAPCNALAEASDGVPAVNAPNRVPWSGCIGVEGEVTGDGRLIEINALRWETLPLPLRYVATDNGGHDGAVVVGTIDTITRAEDGSIMGTGTLDASSAAGQEAIRQVAELLTNGVSMDLDDVSFELRVASELLEDSGLLATGDSPGDEMKPDADGRVKVMEIKADDEVRVTTSARIRAATIVAIPAFATAKIALSAAGPDDGLAPTEDTLGEQRPICLAEGCDRPGTNEVALSEDVVGMYCDEHVASAREESASAETLIASAIPVAPSAAWFSNPKLSAPTSLRVTDEGRVFGHLAAWHTCHTSHTGKCVMAPKSATGYAYFTTGTLISAEGAEIAVGRITLDTRHAGPTLSAASATSHYEDTGTAIADVCAGEDQHGIWVSGALRPGTTPTQIRALRSAPLSGDWRRIGSNLELVAALAVNVPGFPIPRPSGLVAAGVVKTLVASGMVAPRRVRKPGTTGALSLDDLRYLKRLADRERAEDQRSRLGDLSPSDAMAAKVRAFALKRRVDKMHDRLTAADHYNQGS